MNMAEYFLGDRIREGRGGRPALHHSGDVHPYDRVHATSNRVAGALLAAGVRREERVVLALPDRPEFVAAFFGVLKMGGVVAMIDPQADAEALASFLEYTRARALFLMAHTLPRF